MFLGLNQELDGKNNVGIFLSLKAADQKNFAIEFSAATSSFYSWLEEHAKDMPPPNLGWGTHAFIPHEDLFNPEKKLLSDDGKLILELTVS